MNLAVLTGRQVANQLKVFIVSHSGEIADVTLHSSCSSQDLSALKVSIHIVIDITFLYYYFDYGFTLQHRLAFKQQIGFQVTSSCTSVYVDGS